MKRYWRLHRPHYKETWQLGLPVIIAQIGQITVGLADNMMIGRLGATQLAAASFANTLFALPLIFGMGFAMAITPMIGQAYGDKKPAQVALWWKSGLISNIIMAAILLLTILLLHQLMPFMGQPNSILPLSQPYFIIIGFSIIPLMVFLSGKQTTEGMSDTRTAMIITLSANVLNIAGNYILINGKLGLPVLGLNGAGISTLIARIFMAVGMTIAISRNKMIREGLNNIIQPQAIRNALKRLYSLGLPMGIHMFSEASAFNLAAIMMGWIGELGLAAHQVVISLSTFGFMLYQGIGVSTTIRVSQLTSRQIPGLIKRAGKASTQIVVAMVIVISSFFILGRHWLPTLFTTNAEVIRISSELIVIMVIFQIFDALQIIYAGILRGLSDAKIPGIITFTSYFIIALPVSYWAAFKGGLGEPGIWLGFPVGLSICALLFYIRIRYILRQQQYAFSR
ncbi:MATE family efflux transporter [Marinilabiliaceae bacterium JC017]|nr:MATE family efflux transporter [Marinilabiliaceae bacterium JC017]